MKVKLALLASSMLLPVSVALAGPGELTVVSVSSVASGLAAALARFESETGQAVVFNHASRAQIRSKVHSADHPDIVIASEESMDALAAGGSTQADTRFAMGRVGIGVAVARGAALPDLSSVESVTRAFLQARSLVHADPQDDPAGQQARAVIDRLGIADAVKDKTRLGTGSNPLAAVGFGDVELGLHPINEILSAPRLQLVAPLPSAVQQWTRYDIAMVADAPNVNEAKRLLEFLKGETAWATFKAEGFERTK